MLLSDVSVKRPVFASVINLLVITFGIVAFTLLPLREYPDIDAPVVSINTSYPGASAAIVETKITQVLEDRISGISGVKNITSTSRDGRSSISIEFELSRDIDAAANDVRERISRALNNLPEQALPPEVFKSDDDDDVIAWFNLRSENMSVLELTDYANRYIVDRFAVVDGVARIRVGGGRDYVMKLSLDRQAMAARGITVNDIENTLRNENVELPAGQIKSVERDFAVRVNRTYLSPEDFKTMVIGRGTDGHLVSVAEVAKVELTAADDNTLFRGNGVNMVGLGLIKQSKANTLEVVKGARAELQEIAKSLPQGTFIVDSYDSSVFIQGSIDEVYNTLQIAIVLVIAVIFLFLGNIRATLIPAITVPVALIGAFTVLYMLDFSINLLTLLALVLAIGLVVDDAIVVLENIYSRIEKGEPPLVAAYQGAREVGFAVIATTLVLVAVFVPLVFLQGNIGRLFTEFALAIVAAVIFSSFTALTLSPMMCSKFLKAQPKQKLDKPSIFKRAFSTIEEGYQHILAKSLHAPLLLLLVFLLALLSVDTLFKALPSEYAPKEDRGGFFVSMRGAEGASFESNKRNIEKIESVLMESLERGELERVLVRVPGFGGSGGIAIVGMPEWDKREIDTFTYINNLRPQLGEIVDVQAFAIMRRGLGGRGLGRPVQFVLQGNTYEELAMWRDTLFEKAQANPSLIRLDSDYQETYPQFSVEINRKRAADLGVSVAEIGRTLQTMLGQRRVTTYIERGEEYDVLLEGEDSDFLSPSDIDNIYVRSARTNQLIPLANLVEITEQATSAKLNRYNRLRSITISANLADGYTLGEALNFLNNLVVDELPAHAKVDYKGQSQMMQENANSMLFVFALALLIAYLVMAAQFESFTHPIVILLTVPLALVGALAGLYFSDMSVNIFSQIGLVMLIGLAAKNGILIVEFANQLRDKGVEFEQALLEASKHRLRPIIMTSITTVMSAIPLVVGTGPGSESRMVIGMVILAGVTVASIMTLFVVPAAYYWLCKNTDSPQAVTQRLKKLLSK
ncbi:efflux RND transporter permease subunit [Catenovulum sp. SM1970]|uniref:efflux RND transporter permease subunit n=1 Tax=Marinifaba aquimaris TaxID=2741323 RepID=UPI001574498F|nr:efflux RND transporter permease subunit [Marinifaba aquimaris]NTS75343.1 efflux RND transporter permease subunit [Marinifaba aquimaris]